LYRGRELQRRLADRVREADADTKNRAREQEELEELKAKIFSGGYDNRTQEFEKVSNHFHGFSLNKINLKDSYFFHI